jgi:hypothetical protein
VIAVALASRPDLGLWRGRAPSHPLPCLTLAPRRPATRPRPGAQGELERGNAAELRAARGALVSLLAQDALTPAARGGTGQAIALHLLAALVAADAGGAAMAAEVHAKGVTRALLDGLARYGAGVMRQFSAKAQVRGRAGPGGGGGWGQVEASCWGFLGADRSSPC